MRGRVRWIAGWVLLLLLVAIPAQAGDAEEPVATETVTTVGLSMLDYPLHIDCIVDQLGGTRFFSGPVADKIGWRFSIASETPRSKPGHGDNVFFAMAGSRQNLLLNWFDADTDLSYEPLESHLLLVRMTLLGVQHYYRLGPLKLGAMGSFDYYWQSLTVDIEGESFGGSAHEWGFSGGLELGLRGKTGSGLVLTASKSKILGENVHFDIDGLWFHGRLEKAPFEVSVGLEFVKGK